jgi:hypothetical protein
MFNPRLVYVQIFCAGTIILSLPVGKANAQTYGRSYSQTNANPADCTSYWVVPGTNQKQCIEFGTVISPTSSNGQNNSRNYSSNSSNYIYPVKHSRKSISNYSHRQPSVTYSTSSTNYIYPVRNSRRYKSNSSQGQPSVTHSTSSGNYGVSNSSSSTRVRYSTSGSSTSYTVRGH